MSERPCCPRYPALGPLLLPEATDSRDTGRKGPEGPASLGAASRGTGVDQAAPRHIPQATWGPEFPIAPGGSLELPEFLL